MKKRISTLVSLVFLAAALASLVQPVKASELAPAGGRASGVVAATLTIKVADSTVVVGQPVKVNITIGPLYSPLASGAVTVTDSLTGKTCTNSSFTLNPFGESIGYCFIALDSLGIRDLTGVYTGDDYFAPATSAPVSMKVNQATTSIPEFYLEGTPVFGQPLTARVRRQVDLPGGGQPTGPVIIQDAGKNVVCSVTVFNGGIGTCTFTVLFVGPQDMIASYAGDDNYVGSVSTPLTLSAGLATPKFILSPDPLTSVVGQDVRMDVNAVGVPGFPPTGRVLLRYDGLTCLPFELVNGLGSCMVNFATPGPKAVQVTYAGDKYYAATTQTALTYTVDRASPAVEISSANPAPSLPGQSFTVNFTVAAQAPGSGTPTGSVSIKEGAATLCLIDLPTTTCTVTISDAGSHILVADYSGDSFFYGGQSAPFIHPVGYGDTYADPAGVCGGNSPCFTSIQPAIQAVGDGKTVKVYPGLYSGDVNLNKPATVALNGDVSLNGSLIIAAGTLNSTGGILSVSGDLIESGGVFNPAGGVVRLVGPIPQKLSLVSRINTLRLDKPAPVGFWRFEEGVGTSITDSSPGHLDGTLVGPAAFTGLLATLNYPNQYALKTDTSYVTVAQSEKLELSNPFTLAAWAYWNGTGNALQVLLSRPTVDDGSQQAGLALGINNGQPVFSVYDGSALRSLTASQSVPVNQWFHLAATYDGRFTRIFMNGQEIAAVDHITVKPLTTSNTSFLIGREFQTGHPEEAWNGKVDEVLVYHKALAAADILLLGRGDEPRNTVTLDKPLALDGDLILGSGTLDVSISNYAVNLRGNWTREDGDFIAHQAAVILDGSAQTISGANGFYHLKRATPGSLTFPSGLTQVVAGTLELHGAAGAPLLLASSTPGAQWQIDPQGSRSLGNLGVSDSANINAARVDATQNNVTNLGNNTNWNFFAPVVAPLNAAATEDQEKLLALPVSDGDGDALLVSVTRLPGHGKLYQADGSARGAEITAASLPATVSDPQHRLFYLFTLDGPAQTSFDIQASDGMVAASGPVYLNLTNVNDPPTISVISDQVMDENGTLGPLAFSVADEETPAGSLLVTAASSDTALVPQTGLALNGSGSSRSLSITPVAGMDGIANITVSVQDNGPAPVTQVFKLTVNPVNDAPLSANKTITIPEDTSYTFHAGDFVFTDTHQDTFNGLLIVKTVGAGSLTTAGGTLAVSDGTLVLDPTTLAFTPAPDANGSPYTSFTFQVRDSHGAFSTSYTLTINVTPVPDAPVAVADAYTTDEDVPLTVSAAQGVLANDYDADHDPLTAVPWDPPAMGSLVLNPDGSFTYTPDPNVNGVDTFSYYADDGLLHSNIVTVTIQINPVVDPPVLKIAPVAAAAEGDTLAFTATFVDPETGLDAYQRGDSVVWSFDDGAAPLIAGLAVSHTFANNGDYLVQATIKNAQGQGIGTDSLTVSVANVAPAVAAGAGETIRLGKAFTRAISFVDPGADTWTATVDYGDGSGVQPLALVGKTASLQHIYTTAGTWVVTVSVVDSDHAAGTAQFVVTVRDQLYLYLPLARH